MDMDFPFIYVNHGSFRVNKVYLEYFFSAPFTSEEKQKIMTFCPKKLSHLRWETDYCLTGWVNKSPQDVVADIVRDLDVFAQKIHLVHSLVYIWGPLTADPADSWHLWSVKKFGEEAGTRISEVFYEFAHWHDGAILRQDVWSFHRILFMAGNRDFRKDIKKNPEKYLQIFKKIVEKVKLELPENDILYFFLQVLLGTYCNGVLEPETIYEMALRAERKLGFLSDDDVYQVDFSKLNSKDYFASDCVFNVAICEIGKKLKKDQTKAYTRVVNFNKKLKNEAKEEIKEYL